MKPLDGMRILTFEQFGAAPYGTMFLADLGADVIKIENPSSGGDAARSVGPHLLGPNDSQYFQSFNLNKRSVTLDIKEPAGRESFLQLAKQADAVVNNLRGDLPATLGLEYQQLRHINQTIVCLHISAYGRNNSRSAWPGYDYLMQAEAGLMSVTGEPEGPPSRIGVSMVDFMTGMTGMVGLLAAVMRARRIGEGCDIDACLFDVALHQLSYGATWFLNTGVGPTRLPRGAHPSVAPVQIVRTHDGWLYVMCMMDKFWDRLVDGIGRSSLKEDPRFSSQAARRENRHALTEVLDDTMSKHSMAHWLSILTGKIPIAPILDVAQAFENDFAVEADMVRTISHPALSDFKILANPIRLDGKRLPQTACSPLGHDNEAVFRGLGLSAEP